MESGRHPYTVLRVIHMHPLSFLHKGCRSRGDVVGIYITAYVNSRIKDLFASFLRDGLCTYVVVSFSFSFVN